MFNWKKFSSSNFDWSLLVVTFLIFAFGLMAIYSVDLSRSGELFFFKKQIIAFSIGLVFFIFAATRRYSFFSSFAKLAYYFSIILLISVLLFGSSSRGTTGWFTFAGFSFQPVEFAKIGLILMTSYVIDNFGRNFRSPLFFFGTAFLSFVLIGLVMLQPDLGSAVLLILIWFGFMFLVKARSIFIIGTIIIGILVSVIGWSFLLEDYQKERILTFVYPEHDPLGSGYNVTQALIAIGSGQIWGRGLGFGSQSQLRFLPEAQTDFVFSVIGEELGFIGIFFLLSLFLFLFWRLSKIILDLNNDFAAAVVYGSTVLFFVQFAVNIGANLGLLPVTGVPLPFVSYGGSSIMMNFLLLGIVESMVRRRKN